MARYESAPWRHSSSHGSLSPITESNIRVTFAKWRCFVRTSSKPGMCFGNDQGQQEIAHWIRILKNDAFRLERFDKDDFALVIGAIHGRHAETPRPAEPY